MSESLQTLQPSRLLCPWSLPGKDTGVGCHFLLQGIFLTQRLNLCPLHWQAYFFYRCVTWEACTLFEYWQIKAHLQKSGLPLASEEILGYLANVQKIRLSKCSDTDMYCFFCVCVRTTLGIRAIPVLHFMLLPLMLICCN